MARQKYIRELNGNIEGLKMFYKNKICDVLQDVDREVRREVMELINDLVNDIYQHTISVMERMSKDYNVYFEDD